MARPLDITVIGIGRVGAPLSAWCVERGAQVRAVEVSAARRAAILDGSGLRDEPDVHGVIEEAIERGAYTWSDSIVGAPVMIVATPEEVLEGIAGDVARAAPDGALVCVSSTVGPRTMREVVAPRFEGVGREVFLAHVPERITPGEAARDLGRMPRIIGSMTDACAARAQAFFGRMDPGLELAHTTPERSALAKMFENVYRDVNVALANELAELADAHGEDFRAIAELANGHPRVHLHREGIGAGGVCLPWASRRAVQLAGEVGVGAPLVRAARASHEELAELLAQRVAGALRPTLDPEQVGTIAMLGLAYKANVGEVRASPALALRRALAARGFRVRVHDPWVGADSWSLEDAVRGAHAIVLATAHDAFAALEPEHVAGMSGAHVFDFVNVLSDEDWVRAGFRYSRRGETIEQREES
ncbi:MAG: nucleotide sugar dehydrogenase [Myxococcota bacterium]